MEFQVEDWPLRCSSGLENISSVSWEGGRRRRLGTCEDTDSRARAKSPPARVEAPAGFPGVVPPSGGSRTYHSSEWRHTSFSKGEQQPRVTPKARTSDRSCRSQCKVSSENAGLRVISSLTISSRHKQSITPSTGPSKSLCDRTDHQPVNPAQPHRVRGCVHSHVNSVSTQAIRPHRNAVL